jgi:hypothetical protein
MGRRIVMNEEELADFVEGAITAAAEDGVLQEAVDAGELVLNVPSGKLNDDDEDVEEEDDDYLDVPTFNNARFGSRQFKLSENPVVARLKGRKVKQPPVYNSSDDDDDALDLPHYDNSAFGQW